MIPKVDTPQDQQIAHLDRPKYVVVNKNLQVSIGTLNFPCGTHWPHAIAAYLEHTTVITEVIASSRFENKLIDVRQNKFAQAVGGDVKVRVDANNFVWSTRKTKKEKCVRGGRDGGGGGHEELQLFEHHNKHFFILDS